MITGIRRYCKRPNSSLGYRVQPRVGFFNLVSCLRVKKGATVRVYAPLQYL